MSRHTVKGRRWDKVAAVVKARDGGQCVVCGSTDDLTVDHLKPVSLFDDADELNELGYDLDNLATMCRSCNSKKGNRRGPIRITYLNPRFFPNETPRTPPQPSFSQNG